MNLKIHYIVTIIPIQSYSNIFQHLWRFSEMVVPKNLDVLFWKILLKKYQPSIFYHGNSHDIGFFHIFPTGNLPDPPSAGLLRGRARELLRRDGAEGCALQKPCWPLEVDDCVMDGMATGMATKLDDEWKIGKLDSGKMI